MVRKISPSQARSNARQAVAKYKTAVRKLDRAVNNYNRAVKTHNNRVRANQQRLRTEINRLNNQPSTTRYIITQNSTIDLYNAYQQVQSDADAGDWNERDQALVDLAEAEAANSAHVTNMLLGQGSGEDQIEPTSLTDELSVLDDELDRRWQGALFALNPRNPDAARQFCTSSREVITKMIDLKASDAQMIAANPDCELKDGKPARRAKLNYLLERFGANHTSLGHFADTNISDVMKLFRVFNDGTHGSAGKFDTDALRAIKERVEGAIRFLSTVIRSA